MTYQANTQKSVINSRTFVVLRPKRRVTGWTFVSGNTYSADFQYGDVTRVKFNGIEFNEGQYIFGVGPVLSSGEYVYSHDDQKVFVYFDSVPTTDDWIVCFYEILISDIAGDWYRIPNDPLSSERHWEGFLLNSPTWAQRQDDILFGFFPIEVSNISVINGLRLFNRHVHDSSWNDGEVLIYHQLGDAETENIKQIYRGFTRNISVSDSNVTIALESIIRVLETRYQNQRYFSSSDFPNIDPEAVNPGEEWPIRKIYGIVEGLIPVNVDYSEIIGVNVNRDWVVSYEQITAATIIRNIDVGGPNTAVQTTVDNTDGISIGDWVFLEHSAATDLGAKVTGISGNTLIHTNIGARTITAGDTCTRYFVGYVGMKLRDNSYIELELGRDWVVSTFANNSKGIILTDNFEANFAFSDPFDPGRDTLYVRVYGETSILNYTNSGDPITTAYVEGGNLNNIPAIIYSLLREIPNYDPAAIDEDSFVYAEQTVIDGIGMTIPAGRTETEYPTYREIINNLLRTGLLRLQINDVDGFASLALSVIEPLESSPVAIFDETQFQKVNFKYDYQDVYSDVKAIYQRMDIRSNTLISPSFTSTENYQVVEAETSLTALYIHEIERTFEIETLHVFTDEALTFARKVKSILGDRRGIIQITGKNDFILAELGETYQIDRESLPGYAFEEGTTRSRKFALVESEKSPTQVSLILNDQKGIEDNTSLW